MKKLYRITQDKKIAGVCTGIADMIGVDPNIVRIVTVFLCVATLVWPAIIAYVAAWVLLPEFESSQRSTASDVV